MTTMMTSSQFGLEDMEALLWGPSSPMADPMGSLFFHPDQEENQEGGGMSPEGGTSPVSPLSSSSIRSPPNFYSPPSSPPTLLHGVKAGNDSDLLTLPWLEHPDQLRCEMVSGDRKEEPLGALDWMAEKMDLSEFDLDSLIGSCSPSEESISSPDDLLASLDCSMELDSLPVPTLSPPVLSPPITLPTACEDASVATVEVSDSHISGQEVPSSPPCVPEPQEELEIKSEPASPDQPTPMIDSPSSPVNTLDLGSEVDVSETEARPVLAAVVPQVQRYVFSLTPTHLVLVLAPQNEVGITTTTVTATPEVAHSSPPASPPQSSCRSRPYPEPKYKASPPSPDVTKVKSLCGTADDEDDDDDSDDDDFHMTLKAPKDKKLKKMAQNKTAATRYRKKKRSEQDALSAQHLLLERKNMELKEKAESMAREIKYLKELMEEVRLTRVRKGLSPDP